MTLTLPRWFVYPTGFGATMINLCRSFARTLPGQTRTNLDSYSSVLLQSLLAWWAAALAGEFARGCGSPSAGVRCRAGARVAAGAAGGAAGWGAGGPCAHPSAG